MEKSFFLNPSPTRLIIFLLSGQFQSLNLINTFKSIKFRSKELRRLSNTVSKINNNLIVYIIKSKSYFKDEIKKDIYDLIKVKEGMSWKTNEFFCLNFNVACFFLEKNKKRIYDNVENFIYLSQSEKDADFVLMATREM